MKQVFSFFLFIICSGQLLGQGFTGQNPLKEGLYDSFYDFRSNQPNLAGEIKYLKSNSGNRIRKLIINEDSLYFNSTQAYGYLKDASFYLNVLPIINKLEPGRVPSSKFVPIEELGYYSYLEVPTEFSTNSAAVAGGLVGALVVITINEIVDKKGREANNRLIAIHHQTGREYIVDEYFTQAILDSLALYNIDLSGDPKDMLLEQKKSILSQFNALKAADLDFNPEMFYGELIFTRRAKRQSEVPLEIFVNGEKVGSLQKQLKCKVNHRHPVLVEFKANAKKELSRLEIDIASKEQLYYRISYKEKSPDKIDIDKIDVTRTKYVLEEYD